MDPQSLFLLGPWWGEEHVEAYSRARQVAREVASSFPAPRDDREARQQAPAIVRALGDRGAFSPLAAEPIDLRTLLLWREALAYESPLADALWAIQALVALPLRGETSPPVARGLERILAGEAVAAFAMTEPEAGSDLSRIETRAEPDGAGYRLNGEKHLISNAGVASVLLVFARTAPPGARHSISAFLVEADQPGVEFEGAQVLSEPHPLGRYRFRDCPVGVELRVGQEGEGLRRGLQVLERMRVTVAAAACGMAQRALEEALVFVTHRVQFGKRLAEQQMVQAQLADSEVELAAARLLVARAAWLHDRQSPARAEAASAAKLYATEAAQRIVDRSVQLLGGRGVLADSWTDRLYRAVRALRIYEGTSEIQRLLVARNLLSRFEAEGGGISPA